MIKANWNVEELVALIDIHRRRGGKTPNQIETELIKLSAALTTRAGRLGPEHSPHQFFRILSDHV